MTIRRREVFVLGGIVTKIYGLSALPWEQLTGGGLTYVEIEDVPLFRRLKTEGQTSSASVGLIGHDGPSDDAEARHARMEAMRADPCPALFGTNLPTGVVPIAYFSEFRCPFCRALEQNLDVLLDRSELALSGGTPLDLCRPQCHAAQVPGLPHSRGGLQGQPVRMRLQTRKTLPATEVAFGQACPPVT
jgi:hypothetical protein